eukprot:365927-Chlamydomonas_euryale.AAC.7
MSQTDSCMHASADEELQGPNSTVAFGYEHSAGADLQAGQGLGRSNLPGVVDAGVVDGIRVWGLGS